MKLKIIILLLIVLIFSNIWSGEKFHFAVLSDRTGRADQRAYEQVVTDIINLYPDLVVTVGDIIEDGIFEDWEVALTPLEGLNCPIFFTPGNNDIIDSETEDNYREMTGSDPYHSFTYLNSHFIILDNSRFDNYSELGETQLKWLKNDLETNKNITNIFVLMHKPFWAEVLAADKPDSLHTLFLEYNVKAVFTGHWHHYAHEVIDGIEYYICGSSGGMYGDLQSDQLAEFYQYLWCYVDDDQLNVTLMKAGASFPKDQMNLNELNFTYRIPGNYIQTECSLVNDNASEQNLKIQIANMNDEIIQSDIEIIPNGWEISQTNIPVVLAAHDTLNLFLQLNNKTNESIFPEVVFNYPFGRNKTYPYRKTAPIIKTLESNFVNELPAIDGILESNESENTHYYPLYDIEGGTDELENSILLSHDESALYLAIECEVVDPERLIAKGETGENSIFSDDYMGLILSTDGENYTQFYINLLGNFWFLQSNLINKEAMTQLPDNFHSESSIRGNIWTVELEIPFSIFKTLNPQKITMNFRKHLTQPLKDHYIVPEWSYNSAKRTWIVLN